MNVGYTTPKKRRRYSVDNAIGSNMWVWQHWVTNNFRKASEIDYERNGVCATFRLKTDYGEIVCCVSKSPYAITAVKSAIMMLYKLSGELAPTFTNICVFKRIEAIEHG